jgi:hypothetical protein
MLPVTLASDEGNLYLCGTSIFGCFDGIVFHIKFRVFRGILVAEWNLVAAIVRYSMKKGKNIKSHIYF